MPALLGVKFGSERRIASLFPEPGSLPLQDLHPISLPEAKQEGDLARASKNSAHPQHLPPAQSLSHGAGDGWAGGSPYQRRERDQAHCRAALLGDEYVADDSRAEHVGGDCDAGQGAGEDEHARGWTYGGEDRERREEDVGDVDDWVAPVQLGEGCDKQGTGGLAELPDGHEQHARGAGGVSVVQVIHDGVCYRHHGDTCESSVRRLLAPVRRPRAGVCGELRW